MKFTKLGTKRTEGQQEPWVSSFLNDRASVSSYSVITKETSTIRTAHSPLQRNESSKSLKGKQRLVLSKSMEKTFRKYIAKPSSRHAFVEAEIATSVASQIRAIRIQRGWTQSELARKLETTQAAVSRMEDPSYGRLSVKTLIQLANVFDAGLSVEFVPFVSMVCENWVPYKHLRKVESFETDAQLLAFEVGECHTSYVIDVAPSTAELKRNSIDFSNSPTVVRNLVISL